MKFTSSQLTAFLGLVIYTHFVLPTPAIAETLYVPSGNHIYAVDANGRARVLVDCTNPQRSWSQPVINVMPKLLFCPDGAFPFGLAIDSAGNLFSTLQGTDQILRFSPDGGMSVFQLLKG